MIKELLLAVLLGALLGLGATGGYYTLRNNQSKAIDSNNPSVLSETSPESHNGDESQTNTTDLQETTSSHSLTVTSPENETLFDTPVAEIKGTTTPHSTIIVQSPTKSYTAQADKMGNFSVAKVELEGGINLIQVSSIDPNDNQADTELLLTYSSAKI